VEYLDLLKLNKEGYLVIHRIHKILEVYLVILKINLYKANKQGAFLDKIHNKLHNLVVYLVLLNQHKEDYLVIHRIHKILEAYLVILKLNLLKANKQVAFLVKIHNRLLNLVVYLVQLNHRKEDYLVILKHKMLEDYLVIHKPKIQEAYLVIIKDHNK
jgi:hypothetical protein